MSPNNEHPDPNSSRRGIFAPFSTSVFRSRTALDGHKYVGNAACFCVSASTETRCSQPNKQTELPLSPSITSK
ncbi:hypothetical protein VTN49DRAFT_6533 [Thermomyces lanuginosus]|uniref:uncharacterized protein n=1 Tax=Thermomyces lanuginosus TaxID=5541 RepID=UPI0037441030